MIAATARAWSVVRPRTIDHAVAALAHAGPTGMPHAGGTDLMVRVKEGRCEPGTIVDLSLVDELRGIELGDETIVIGAARPMADLLADPRVTTSFPALADAIRVVGSVQIRHRASLGGNIANASPAADTVPVLVALGAVARIAGPAGRRSAPVASLLAGPGRTTLAPAEIITAIEIPTAPRSASAYLRLTRRTSVDLALISAAVVLPEGEPPRVAFGAAGPVIERNAAVEDELAVGWPRAEAPGVASRDRGDAGRDTESGAGNPLPFSDGDLDRAARAAVESVRPISDVRAGERYRRAMAGVLLVRAVRVALGRVGSESDGEGGPA